MSHFIIVYDISHKNYSLENVLFVKILSYNGEIKWNFLKNIAK